MAFARAAEPAWGSLKIIEAVLPALGIPADDAPAIMEPLRTLHNLRSKVRGHAVPEQRRVLEKAALTEHATFHAHFQSLAGGCDTALTKVVEALDSVDQS